MNIKNAVKECMTKELSKTIRKPLLSIVIPCYNEQEALEHFYTECSRSIPVKDYRYEMIFVNDGSKDATLDVLNELKIDDKHIRIINFSRNFGKEAAILAGLKHSEGDVVVVMDADLQDPPCLLREMCQYIESGEYDSVATCRSTRDGEPKIRSWFARKFYRFINKMSDVEIVDGARDYRMMTRGMVDAVLSMHEYHRFSKGIFSWVGFKTKYIAYENVERVAGDTKWNFWGLFKYAIEGIVGFTTVPLRIATLTGALISLLSFCFMLFIAFKAVYYGDPVAGYPSLVVIISMLGGIQLLFMGIIGEYLARTYMETKRRPSYIIKDIK